MNCTILNYFAFYVESAVFWVYNGGILVYVDHKFIENIRNVFKAIVSDNGQFQRWPRPKDKNLESRSETSRKILSQEIPMFTLLFIDLKL